MEKTHWKKLTNPDYLGAYALQAGEEKTLTIRKVSNEVVVGTDGKKETCQVAFFVEREKPMILNRTNMKTIAKIYNSPYIEDWGGKKITVYVKKVKAFGEVVDALRIREHVPKDEQPCNIKCSDCGKVIESAHNMSGNDLAKYTEKNYGVPLCSECALKRAKARNANNNNDDGSVSDENNNN